MQVPIYGRLAMHELQLCNAVWERQEAVQHGLSPALTASNASKQDHDGMPRGLGSNHSNAMPLTAKQLQLGLAL